MGRPIAEIAAEIKAKGYNPLGCVSAPFANGLRFTVWFDALTTADYAELRRLLEEPQPSTPTADQQARWRAHRAAESHNE